MTRRGRKPRPSPRRGPFRQGDLDGLCGLYSAVNAICLVPAPQRPLSRNQARVLFRSGITHLNNRGLLRPAHAGPRAACVSSISTAACLAKRLGWRPQLLCSPMAWQRAAQAV